jgi:putative transposase
MRQALRFQGQTKQVTISKRAGKYFASILVETNDYNPNDNNRQDSAGVDFGIKELAVLSNGEVFNANQKLKGSLNKLAKLQKNFAKKVKGSNQRAKAKLKIQKLHLRITNQRHALLHQLSDYLTKTFNIITIKAKLRNCIVVIANRFYPSSKTCSCCGKIKNNLKLADRVFICDCGFNANRDLNAAMNLNKYGRDTLQPDLKRAFEQC